MLGPIDSLGALYRGGQPSGAVERLVEALGVGKPAANAPVAVQKAADAGEAASPALPFVPKAAKGLVNAMVAAPRAGSRAGQIGAIRVGGAPDLYATHSVAPSSLFSYNEKRVPGGRAWQKELAGTLELSNPSIAIRSDTLSNPFGHDLRLIPRQGAFDPATSASTLFNRDAYTPRARDYEGSIAAADFNKRVAGNGEVRPVDRFAAKHRLVERLFMDPAALHGTERLPDAVIDDNVRAIFDGRVTRSLGHDTAIAASPSFRSFRDFERSRAGAATLRKEGDYDEYWREALQDPLKGPINTQLNEVMGKLYRRHYPNDAFPDDTELREAIIRFHAQPKALREDPEKAREWLENYISNNMGTAVNPGQLAARIDGPFGQVLPAVSVGKWQRPRRSMPSSRSTARLPSRGRTGLRRCSGIGSRNGVTSGVNSLSASTGLGLR